jgi:hypothetical protein
MTARLNPGNQFERKLCEQSGRTLIESRCKQCGEILVGSSIFNDLLEQEAGHLAQCAQATGIEPQG